jgi:hypothetical protein
MPAKPSRVGHRLRRQTAVVGYDGKRECAYCGAHLDPIDWCQYCQAIGSPCNRPHRKLRKPGHAAFCNQACRNAHRNSAVTNINQLAREGVRA